ncbi:hypothetical protein FOA52_012581 [Chlamydomonas sp. UWO 241]|nr:hypothetical protein FOA52_012581 [Chlamydomonas sp. UWO 241]
MAMNKSRGMSLVLLLSVMALLAAGGVQASPGRGGPRAHVHLCALSANATVCPGPADHTLSCKNTAGGIICVDNKNATECPAVADLDKVEDECRGPPPAHVHACALSANATVCPGPSDHTLSCVNTAGDIICVDDKNATECPAAADLDKVDKECRGPPPARVCALSANATVCPGPADHTLSCVNTAGGIICVDDKNATECPAAADLDAVEDECRGPPPAHVHACTLPVNATVCPGPADHTLSCVNTAGDIICVDDKNATECPAAADLDEVDKVCRGPPPACVCALSANATVCPGPADHTLSCVNTAGGIICVDDKNAIKCPAAADLDAVEDECRGPPAHVHTCALPADATVCPGPADHTLSCVNTAGDVICINDKNATECPAAADLDEVEKACGSKPDRLTMGDHKRGGRGNRRMMR